MPPRLEEPLADLKRRSLDRTARQNPGAVAELAVGRAAPALQTVEATERTHDADVGFADAESIDSRQPGSSGRAHFPARDAAAPELSVVVFTETEQAAVVDAACEAVAGPEQRGATDARHQPGAGAVVGGAVTELSAVVVAPAGYGLAGGDGAAVVEADSDR